MSTKKLLLGILPIWVLLFNISCNKKTYNSVTEKIRIDTVREYKVVTKFNAVHDTITIDNPCDSSNTLSQFYAKIGTPQGKFVLRSYKGKIQAIINMDSIESVYKDKYSNHYNSDKSVSEKVVIKTVIPSWIIYLLIFESLIIAGYIYLRINRLIK